MSAKPEEVEWSRAARRPSRRAEEGQGRMSALDEQSGDGPAGHHNAAVSAVASSSAPRFPISAEHPRHPHVSALQDVEEVETVVGVRTTFEGNLWSEAGIRIRGTMQGEIGSAQSIFIDETARVDARIAAANVVVAGRVTGSISCEGRLELLSTGHVTGELTASLLTIQEGAFSEGTVRMKGGGRSGFAGRALGALRSAFNRYF